MSPAKQPPPSDNKAGNKNMESTQVAPSNLPELDASKTMAGVDLNDLGIDLSDLHIKTSQPAAKPKEPPAPPGILGESADAPSMEDSLDQLGPAFPEELAPTPTRPTEPARPPQPEGDQDDEEDGHDKTSATRLLEGAPKPIPSTARVRASLAPMDAAVPLSDQVQPPQQDAWSELDQQDGNWAHTTGESKVASRPPAESLQPSASDSRVFAAGKQVPIEQPMGRLTCLAGKDKGQEFPLDEREVTIGRGSTGGVVLTDPSVSREHARLFQDEDRFFLVDMRSGNGTFVNGERVNRARVRSGDEVGFGNVVMRFYEHSDVFRQVDGSAASLAPDGQSGVWPRWHSSPHFKSMSISAAILVGSTIVALTIAVVRSRDDAFNERRDVIFRHYLEGVSAFKHHAWQIAENEFTVVMGLDPHHARGQRYIEALGREKENEKQLANARANFAREELGQACAAVSGIENSVFDDEVDGLLDQIDTQIAARVDDIKRALDEGNVEQALDLLTKVELDRPGRPDVAALRDRAIQMRAGAFPRGSSTGEGPSFSDSRVVREAEATFAAGKIADALTALRAASGDRDAEAMITNITRFKKAFDEGVDQAHAKRRQGAIRAFKQAKSYEMKITGGHSPYAVDISRQLAELYYQQGMSDMWSDHLPEAYRSFNDALSEQPHHDKALRRLDDLAQKAAEQYRGAQALVAKNPAMARERLKIVLQIVPSTNPLYRQAHHDLDALK